MKWVHEAILKLQRARDERIRRNPGVDIDRIHFKRGAVSERLKKCARLREKYPQ